MPVRIYDIARKLGLESKVVIAKAKELGITHAKVASSTLDKITAEYLEDNLAPLRAVPAPEPAPGSAADASPTPPPAAGAAEGVVPTEPAPAPACPPTPNSSFRSVSKL